MDDAQSIQAVIKSGLLQEAVPAAAAVRDLPFAVHGVILIGLIAGLVLWIFGRRVIHVAFGGIGLALGGAFGFLSAPALGVPEIAPFSAPYVGLFAGCIIGLVGAIVMYRIVLAVSAGVCVSLAAVLIAAVGLGVSLTPPAADGPSTQTAETPAHSEAGRTQKDESGERTDVLAAITASETGERVRVFVSASARNLSDAWQAIPLAHRAVLVFCGFGGLIGGFIAGLFLPRWSASVVTALMGAAVWMPCAAWLVYAAGLAGGSARDVPAAAWLLGWVGLGMIGAASQIIGVRRSKAKATKE